MRIFYFLEKIINFDHNSEKNSQNSLHKIDLNSEKEINNNINESNENFEENFEDKKIFDQILEQEKNIQKERNLREEENNLNDEKITSIFQNLNNKQSSPKVKEDGENLLRKNENLKENDKKIDDIEKKQQFIMKTYGKFFNFCKQKISTVKNFLTKEDKVEKNEFDNKDEMIKENKNKLMSDLKDKNILEEEKLTILNENHIQEKSIEGVENLIEMENKENFIKSVEEPIKISNLLIQNNEKEIDEKKSNNEFTGNLMTFSGDLGGKKNQELDSKKEENLFLNQKEEINLLEENIYIDKKSNIEKDEIGLKENNVTIEESITKKGNDETIFHSFDEEFLKNESRNIGKSIFHSPKKINEIIIEEKNGKTYFKSINY